MGSQSGYNGAVYLGQTQVANIKRWSGGEIARVMLDAAALGDSYDKWSYGPISGGSVTCEGFYDPDDSTGQEVLRSYCLAGTEVSNLRLYYSTGNTDFLTLGQDTKALITNISNTTADRDASGMCPISFTLTISDGVLVRCTAFKEAITIAFTEGGATDTITESNNGLVTAGFTAGMGLIVEGSTSNDGRSYTIAAGGVAAGVITLTATVDDLVAEDAGDTVSLIGYTKLS